MRLTIEIDGREVDAAGFMDQKGIKNSPLQAQMAEAAAKGNAEKVGKSSNEKKTPLTKNNDMKQRQVAALDAKKRAGLGTPSRKRSSETTLKDFQAESTFKKEAK